MFYGNDENHRYYTYKNLVDGGFALFNSHTPKSLRHCGDHYSTEMVILEQ